MLLEVEERQSLLYSGRKLAALYSPVVWKPELMGSELWYLAEEKRLPSQVWKIECDLPLLFLVNARGKR